MQSGRVLLELYFQKTFSPLPEQFPHSSRVYRPSKARPGGHVYFTGVCMMMALSQSIAAPVVVPKSGPLGSHFFAAKSSDMIVMKYLFAYVRNV